MPKDVLLSPNLIPPFQRFLRLLHDKLAFQINGNKCQSEEVAE